MEKKNNKKVFIILGCIIIIFAVVIIVLNVNKNNIDNSYENNVDNIQSIETESEEDKLKREIEEKEKQYKENSNYQCFNDETFGIRLYYNNIELKYGSLIAQAGKLALQETNGDNMFLYSTNELDKDYDKNAFIQNYIQGQVKSGFTIVDNKDVTISNITPIQARCVECRRGNVVMKHYVIFKEKGACNFVVGTIAGTDSAVINEILDTIINE